MYKMINRIGAFVVGGAALLFGIIGWLWHYCPHIPCLMMTGAMFVIYGLVIRKDLIRFIWSVFSIFFLGGQIVYNNIYLSEDIHTWLFFIFCVAFIIFFLVDAIVQWPRKKGAEEEAAPSTENAEGTAPAPAAAAAAAGGSGEPYYMLRRTDKGNTIFFLKSAEDKQLAVSKVYPDLDSVKAGVDSTRAIAYSADVDDMTNADNQRMTGSRYEMWNSTGHMMRSRLTTVDNEVILVLPDAEHKAAALQAIAAVIADSRTEKVVDCTSDAPVSEPDENLFGTGTALDETMAVINEARAAAATHVSSEPIQEAPEGEGTEVVGIAFPERPKVYFFKPEADGIKYKVGDVVLVPTLSIDRVVGVAIPNVRLTDDQLVLPLKSILQMVSKA
ncbi:MAG: hypothetical protein J6023_00545 [Clostridia bacterium]|nr:hypothetical protein [Clostridia bacterium]